MKLNHVATVLSMLACALASSSALAQKKVPGETWRHTVSMQAAGFSMPARTSEVCSPVGKIEETIAQQQQENCSISNLQQGGNRMSYDFKCTGQDAFEGRFESETSGNTVRGTMTGKTGGESMTMKFETTRVGQSCEALDYSDYKPPVVEAPKMIDHCAQIGDRFDSDNLASIGRALLTPYPRPDGQGVADCTTHASFQRFCSAAQTPAGFASLEYGEWQMRGIRAANGEDAAARMIRAPLTEAVRACGLGTGPSAIAALQKQVLAKAVTERRWGFLLYYGADEQYPVLQAAAQRECSGRSFTNAANRDYGGLCRNYGAALARNDRAGVLEAAGCSVEREDAARGICIGATSQGTGAVAQLNDSGSAAGAAAGSASGSAQPDGGAKPADAAEKSAADAAKEALDKGKRALRGLFGG